jgi:hypothetical protein
MLHANKVKQAKDDAIAITIAVVSRGSVLLPPEQIFRNLFEEMKRAQQEIADSTSIQAD